MSVRERIATPDGKRRTVGAIFATIAEAESEGESVKAVTLTRWLDVSAPAVTMAIRRLKRDGLITVGD